MENEETIQKLKSLYRRYMNKELNLNNPRTISEKIQYLKIFDNIPAKTICSDKLEVRKYCKEKLGLDYFIPVIKEYNRFDDIKFEELPKNYVIKTNHGSHTNIIVRNGNINVKNAKLLFDDWLSKDWSWYGLELCYCNINRKIFVEEYMNDGNDDLADYKFLCFNGIPKLLQIIKDRNNINKHLNYYDMDFTPRIDLSRKDFKSNYNIKDEKPTNFEKMISICNILSKDFKLVRIDFYEINKIMYLGELTFYPAAGYLKYENAGDNIIGDMLKL